MYPGTWARQTPDKPALVIAETGETLTYAQLDENSLRLAHVLADAGFVKGDVVALLSDNTLQTYEVYWAARAGPLHHRGQPQPRSDRGRIHRAGLRRQGADRVRGEGRPGHRDVLDVPHAARLWRHGRRLRAVRRGAGRREPAPLADQPHGDDLLYSSGTTGRPKGIKLPLPDPGRRAGLRLCADLRRALRLRRRHGLSLARAGLPRGAAALHGRRPRAGRHGGDDAKASTPRRSSRPWSGTASRTPRWCRRCSCGCSSCPRRSARSYDLSSLRPWSSRRGPMPRRGQAGR